MAVCLVAAGYSGFVPASDHAPELYVVGRDGTRVEIMASTSAAADTDVANATA